MTKKWSRAPTRGTFPRTPRTTQWMKNRSHVGSSFRCPVGRSARQALLREYKEYNNIYTRCSKGGAKAPPFSRDVPSLRRSDAPSLRRCDTQASTPQSSRLVWVVRRTVVPSHVVPSLRGSVVPLGAAGLTSTKETPLSETELRESLSLLISSKTQDPGAKDSRHKAKAQDPGAKAHDRRAQARKAGAKAQDPRAKAQEPRAEVEDRDLKPKTAEVKPRDNWIPVEPRNRSPAARKSPLGGSEIWSKWLPKGALEASGRALDGLWEAFGRQGRF